MLGAFQPGRHYEAKQRSCSPKPKTEDKEETQLNNSTVSSKWSQGLDQKEMRQERASHDMLFNTSVCDSAKITGKQDGESQESGGVSDRSMSANAPGESEWVFWQQRQATVAEAKRGGGQQMTEVPAGQPRTQGFPGHYL